MIEAEKVIAEEGLTVSSEMGGEKNTLQSMSVMTPFRSSPVWVHFSG